MVLSELVVLDSSDQPAATCVTCGNPVQAGGGVTALFHGRTLRFRCPVCLERFAVDPDHFLTDGPSACCEGQHDGEPKSLAPDSSPSE